MEVKLLSQIPLQETDVVLLDLDNTLYGYSSCHNPALNKLAEEMSKKFPVSADKIKELYNTSRKKTNQRLHGTAVSHSRLFYIQEMVEALSGKTDTVSIPLFHHLYWDTFISSMHLFPDVIPFLQSLENLNITVVLVTDMTAEIQFRKIEQLGISRYLSFIVTSEEAGIEKPDSFIFDYAIEKAKNCRNDIRHISIVGDDIKKDCFASEKYTVQNFHLKREQLTQ